MNLDQEIKELVIARLKTLPDDKSISMGSEGEFTKEDLVEHVEKGDGIGQKMIEIEMDFLRNLKKGFDEVSPFLLPHPTDLLSDRDLFPIAQQSNHP